MISSAYLEHHGVKGQHWGVRRFQNVDGTLTNKGQKHYALQGLKEGLREHTNATNRNYKKYKTDANMANALHKQELKTNKERILNDGSDKLRTAYHKAAISGGEYINSKFHKEVYKAYVKAYSKNRIKAGKDYVSDITGKVTLTESGRQKEMKLLDKVDKKFKQKNSTDMRNVDYLYKMKTYF